MILKFQLKENDYFQMQLYFLKEDNQLRKIIIKNSIIWFIVFSIIILILFLNKQNFAAILLSIGAFISLIIQPNRIKSVYFKRLKKETKLYQSKFNQIITLEINEDYLMIVGNESESKINISQVQKIIETKLHFFIKLNPEVIIIPKSEIENQSFIKDELIKLTRKEKIEFENKLSWKW